MHPYHLPLGAMIATQVAAAAVLAAVPVLAPEMARSLGVEASLVGVFTGLVFAAATLGSAASGALIGRLGAFRTNQIAVTAAGAGLLVAAFPSAIAAGAAALVIGAGYGPNTPSSSEVLARTVPPRRRALAFSIKQSGAPLGGMLAGVSLPFIVAAAGWQAAIAAVAALAFAVAASIEPLRRRLDPPARAAPGTPRPRALESMRFVLRDPALRRLAAAGFALMIAHGCFQTFYVAFLVEGLGLSLALAGAMFAVLQGGGAIARVALGWLADRLRDARMVLTATGACALVAAGTASRFDADTPLAALLGVSLLAGVGSSGWYGVFLAEVARIGTAERAGLATGGTLFFVYGAIVGGPLAISALVARAGGYGPAFALVAVFAALAAVTFARTTARRAE